MRHLRVAASLWTLTLFVSTTLAQTGNSQAGNNPPSISKASAAASERSLPTDPCASPTAATGTFCEVAQRRFGPQLPARRGRPRGSYPGYPGGRSPGHSSLWMGEGHPGHAAIGALILGGLGATLAANTHPNGQKGPNVVGAIFVGGLGAVVGGFIGNSIPWSHSQRFHQPSWPDEDELGSRNTDSRNIDSRNIDSRNKEQQPQQSGLAQPSLSLQPVKTAASPAVSTTAP